MGGLRNSLSSPSRVRASLCLRYIAAIHLFAGVGAVRTGGLRQAPIRLARTVAQSRREHRTVSAHAQDVSKDLWDITYDISDADSDKTRGWKTPIRVAVSGAAGQISNHLLFMLCSGDVFGADQPVILQLLGSERSKEALEGVRMELEDSLYPLLREVQVRALQRLGRAWCKAHEIPDLGRLDIHKASPCTTRRMMTKILRTPSEARPLRSAANENHSIRTLTSQVFFFA